LIESVPAVWDETIVLPGSEIGECAAFARRTGETWFVAVINGGEARSLSVPLTFLGEGRYQAVIVKDRQGDPAAVDLERSRVLGKQDVLKIDCPAGGGFLARLRPG
jgi:alpha-glucosidase